MTRTRKLLLAATVVAVSTLGMTSAAWAAEPVGRYATKKQCEERGIRGQIHNEWSRFDCVHHPESAASKDWWLWAY